MILEGLSNLAAALLVIVFVAIVSSIGYLVYSNRRLRNALENATTRLESLQLSFHRFVPQQVVETVIDKGVGAYGERREITVLFADLQGFTALSEPLKPEKIVQILNGFFRAMSRTVRRHNGFVVRFLGDGLLAIFGAPEPNPWHTQDAARAAVAMQDRLRQYSADIEAKGHPSLKMGVGLDTGNVMAGIMGSDELMEFTVIGDIVNTAARIESLTRHYEQGILISERLAAALDERFLTSEKEPLGVKGKSEPIRTYALTGIDEGALRAHTGDA